MRDPARIDRVLALVRDQWKRHPDLRLTQLVLNVVGVGADNQRNAFFFEDDELEERLRASVTTPAPAPVLHEVSTDDGRTWERVETPADGQVVLLPGLRYRKARAAPVSEQGPDDEGACDFCGMRSILSKSVRGERALICGSCALLAVDICWPEGEPPDRHLPPAAPVVEPERKCGTCVGVGSGLDSCGYPARCFACGGSGRRTP